MTKPQTLVDRWDPSARLNEKHFGVVFTSSHNYSAATRPSLVSSKLSCNNLRNSHLWYRARIREVKSKTISNGQITFLICLRCRRHQLDYFTVLRFVCVFVSRKKGLYIWCPVSWRSICVFRSHSDFLRVCRCRGFCNRFVFTWDVSSILKP